ncbi:hypothetical protein ABKN59_004002 [Abortiporus biennis]
MSALPNPFTPLAFLPPDIATQFETTRYIYAATVGALTWDIIASFGDECKMWRFSRFGIMDVVYVLSRMTTYIQVFLSFFNMVHTFDGCQVIVRTITGLSVSVACLNCLLFVFRITAVFNSNKSVVRFFWLLWLSVVGLSIYAATTINTNKSNLGLQLGPTVYCVALDVKRITSIGIIAVAAHDTLIWLAISWKLIMDSADYVSTRKAKVNAVLTGAGMGRITRTLFTSAQLYYFVTISTNIATVIIIFLPSTLIPKFYQSVPENINVAILNLVACRVYRQLRLGLISDPYASQAIPTSILGSRFTPQFAAVGTTNSGSVSIALPTEKSGLKMTDRISMTETETTVTPTTSPTRIQRMSISDDHQPVAQVNRDLETPQVLPFIPVHPRLSLQYSIRSNNNNSTPTVDYVVPYVPNIAVVLPEEDDDGSDVWTLGSEARESLNGHSSGSDDSHDNLEHATIVPPPVAEPHRADTPNDVSVVDQSDVHHPRDSRPGPAEFWGM